MIECTQRESEVLVFLAHGLSNKAIALRLGISQYTVRDHVCSLMEFLGLSNRVELAICARECLWKIGGNVQPYRLTEHIPMVTTSEDKWCGQRFHLIEHHPLHL